MDPEVVNQVNVQIERLFKAKFIITTRYVTWLFNSVPIIKKNSKLHVCIGFKIRNNVTPKDKYPTPIADIFIYSTVGNYIRSFIDGHFGYNIIFIIEDKVNKPTFSFPRLLGT